MGVFCTRAAQDRYRQRYADIVAAVQDQYDRVTLLQGAYRVEQHQVQAAWLQRCLLYTSDAADDAMNV